MAVNIYPQSVTPLGWDTSFHVNGKFPLQDNTVFSSYALAKAFVEDPDSSAIPATLIGVADKNDKSSSGIYEIYDDNGVLNLRRLVTGSNSSLYNDLINSINAQFANYTQELANLAAEQTANLEELRREMFSPDAETSEVVRTMLLQVGSDSTNYRFSTLENDKLDTEGVEFFNDTNVLEFKKGNLFHFSIKIDSTSSAACLWQVALPDSGFKYTLLPDSKIWIYIKASKTSGSDAKWYLSTDKYVYDSEISVTDPDIKQGDSNYFYFLYGYTGQNKYGKSFYEPVYGNTWIKGSTIYTGKIQSMDGTSRLDLDNNELILRDGLHYNNGEIAIGNGNAQMYFHKNGAYPELHIGERSINDNNQETWNGLTFARNATTGKYELIIGKYDELIKKLQSEIDNDIQTWYGNGYPLPFKLGENNIVYASSIQESDIENELYSTYPFDQWHTDQEDLCKKHIGDIYIDGRTSQCWRFIDPSNGEESSDHYYWELIKDEAISNIYNIINSLQSLIDGKIQTWCLDLDPSKTWDNDPADLNYSGDLNYKYYHLGDLWYCTDTENTAQYKKAYEYTATESKNDNGVITGHVYSWKLYTGDNSIFDFIDGQSAIYNNFAVLRRDGYHSGDWYMLEADSDDSETFGSKIQSGENKYLKGLLLYAKNDKVSDFKWGDWAPLMDNPALVAIDLENKLDDLKDDLLNLIDHQITLYYQENDPSENWNENEKKEHVKDIWYCTATTGEYAQKTWKYLHNNSGYYWEETNAYPASMFDKIDGSATIYAATCEEIRSIAYKARDYWMLMDTPGVQPSNLDAPYYKNDILYATKDRGDTFLWDDWIKVQSAGSTLHAIDEKLEKIKTAISIADDGATVISENFIKTMMLAIGSDSTNYTLSHTSVSGVKMSNVSWANTMVKSILSRDQADTITHLVYYWGNNKANKQWTIKNSSVKLAEFNIVPSSSSAATTPLYIYIKCSGQSSEAEWEQSSSVLSCCEKDENGDITYHFPFATIINRATHEIIEARGATRILGDRILTGKLESNNGKSYLDLDNGWFALGLDTTNDTTKADLSKAAFSYSPETGLHIGPNADIHDLTKIEERLGKLELNGSNYIENIIKQGSTDINGGLICSNVLALGDPNGTITSGLSGYSEDGILLWGGGTYGDAINAAKSPNYYISGTTPITTLLKSDGTGKVGILKIGTDNLTINENSGSIVLNGSGIEITKKSESNPSLLFTTGIIDSYVPTISSSEISKYNTQGTWDSPSSCTILIDSFTISQKSLVNFPLLRLNMPTKIWIAGIEDTSSTLKFKYKIYVNKGGSDIEVYSSSNNNASVGGSKDLMVLDGITKTLESGEYKLYCKIYDCTRYDSRSISFGEGYYGSTLYSGKLKIKPTINKLTILGSNGLLAIQSVDNYFLIQLSSAKQKIKIKGLPISSDGLDSGELYTTTSLISSLKEALTAIKIALSHARYEGDNSSYQEDAESKITSAISKLDASNIIAYK